MYIMKEQQHGFSKVKYITNGGQLPLSCGYMANVRFYLVVLRLMDLNLYSGLWEEHYLVCKFPLLSPGLAKTLISSSIIEDIIALREARSASLAYFYFDFRDEDKRNRRGLLLSILSQLSAQSNLYCGVLSRLYSAHDRGARKASEHSLKQGLKDMLSLPAQGPVYLIIDALDECPNNFGMPISREEVLELVNDLVNMRLPNLHICVTSRPEIDIQTALEPLTSLRVSLHNQTGQKKDIVDYVSSVVYLDTNMQNWREEDKRLVIETLSERADGM
jgi:hypothetical protein